MPISQELERSVFSVEVSVLDGEGKGAEAMWQKS